MSVRIGSIARQHAEKANEKRVDRPEQEAMKDSKEHRSSVRNSRIMENDAFVGTEGVVYELPGIPQQKIFIGI